MRIRSRQIGMTENIAGAVHPRSLAIPDTEYAIVFRLAMQSDLLGTPQRSGSNILVDTGLKDDIVVLQVLASRPQLLVVRTKRTASIAGDIAGRVESGQSITHVLHDWQPHQCLGAGDKNAAFGNRVLVVERNVTQSHPV